MWLHENRARISRDFKNPVEAGPECGRQWLALSESERTRWKQKAADASRVYRAQIDAFIKRMKDVDDTEDRLTSIRTEKC